MGVNAGGTSCGVVPGRRLTTGETGFQRGIRLNRDLRRPRLGLRGGLSGMGLGVSGGTWGHRPTFAQVDFSVKVTCHKEKIKLWKTYGELVPIWELG